VVAALGEGVGLLDEIEAMRREPGAGIVKSLPLVG